MRRALLAVALSSTAACMNMLGVDFDPRLRASEEKSTDPTIPAVDGSADAGLPADGGTLHDPRTSVAQAQRLVTAAQHACAIDREGHVWCWGDSSAGRLGAGAALGSQTMPVKVSGISSAASTLAASFRTSCAVASDRLYCWGDMIDGASSRGAAEEKKMLPSVATIAVAPVSEHACITSVGGEVWCWGSNRAGEIGRFEQSLGGRAAAAQGIGAEARMVATGMQFSCALVTDVVRCFGNNVHGILGKPFADVALTPVPQAIAFGGHEHDIVAITAGQDHACALARDNAVWCWGSHAEAQLGSTASTAPGLEPSKSLFTPVNVPGVSDGERVTAVTAGKNHTCVLRESGAVGCWGANGRGQLGSVTALPRSERVVFVRGLEGRVTELSAGDDRTCARTAEGDIYCWGASDSGAADLTAPKLIARLL